MPVANKMESPGWLSTGLIRGTTTTNKTASTTTEINLVDGVNFGCTI